MSSIDERIVRMKWDDSDFSKAAQNTLKLLENVESSVQNLSKVITNPYTTALKTMESVTDGMKKVSSSIGDTTKGISGGVQSALKGFSSIDDSIKKVGSGLSGMFTKVDVSPVEEAAAKVSNAFTLSGRIVNQALDEIASKAVGIGETVANALMINPVSSGFQEYGLLMDSTQVILSNTGRPLEDVNKTLDELNHYADKTIYNFAEMTNAIGRFSAAGVGLEDSTAAIEGLSNLSALVGANAQQNISAMDATSKALASGSLKLRQWMQFEAAGSLGGKVFRDELVKTAQEMGYFSQSWNDATGKSIDGAELLSEAQTSFRETLKYGWVDSQVLLTTLSKFSDETTELGQKAIKAATEVRTFSKMWDAMQEAVQSSWSQSFQYIFGDYDEGTTLWTSINDEIGGLLAKFNDARNDMLKVWHDDGGRDAMIEGIATTYHKIGDALKPIGDAMRDSFSWLGLDATERGNILINASNAFRDWAKGLKLSEDRAAKLYNVFTLLRVPVNNFKDFVESNGIKNLAATFHNVTGAVLNLANSFANAFRNVLGENMLGKGAIFADATKALKGISASVYQLTARSGILLKNAKKGTHEIHSWESIFSNLLTPIRYILNTFRSVNIQDVIAIGSDAFKIFASIVDAASNAVKNFFKYLPTDILGKAVSQLRSYIREIREYTNSIKGNKQIGNVFSGVSRIASGLFSIIVKISSIVSKIIADFTRSGGFMAIAKTWVNLRRAVVDFGNIFLDVVQKKFGSNISMIGSRIAKLKGAFEAITKVIQRVSQLSLFGAVDKDTGKIEGIEKTIFSLSGIVDRLLSPVQYLFELFHQVDFDNITRIGVHAFKSLLAIVNAASISIDKFFGTLDTSWLSRIIEDLRQATKAVRKFLESPEGQEMLTNFFNILTGAAHIAYDVLVQVLGVIHKIINSEIFKTGVNAIVKITSVVLKFGSVVVNSFEKFIRKHKVVKNAFKALGDIMAPFFEGSIGLFNTFAECLDALTDNIDWDKFFPEAASAAIEKIGEGLAWLREKASGLGSYLIEQIVGHLPELDEGETYFDVLLKKLSESWERLKTWLGSIGGAIFDALKNAIFGHEVSGETIVDTPEVLESPIINALKTLGEFVGSVITIAGGAFRTVVDVLIQVFNVIQEIVNSDLFKNGVATIGRIASAAMTFITNFITSIETYLREHKVIQTALEWIGEKVGPIFEMLVNGLSKVAEFVEDIANHSIDWDTFFPETASKVVTAVTDGIGKLKDKAKGVGKYIGDQFSEMKAGLEDGESRFDVFASNLVSGLDGLKKKLANAGGAVFETLKGAIFGYEVSASTLTDEAAEETEKSTKSFSDSVLQYMTDLFESIKDFKMPPGGFVALIKQVFSSLIDGLKTGVSTLASLASDAFKYLFIGTIEEDGTTSKGVVIEFISNVYNYLAKKIKAIIDEIPALIDAMTTLLSPVKDAFVGLVLSINNKLKTFLTQALKSLHLDGLFKSLLTIFDDAVESLPDYFRDKDGKITFETIVKRISEWLGLYRKLGLSYLLTNLGKEFGGIGKLLGSFSSLISKSDGNIKKILSSINEDISGKSGLLTNVSKSLKKLFEAPGEFLGSKRVQKGFNKILNRSGKGVSKFLKLTGKGLNKFFNRTGKGIRKLCKGFSSFAKNTGKGIRRYLTAKAANEVAEGLLKLAVAVGIIAFAMVKVSEVPTDQLIKGGIVIGAILAALLAVAAIILHVANKNKGEGSLSNALEALKGLSEPLDALNGAVNDITKKIQKAFSKLAQIGLIVAFIFAVKEAIEGIVKIGELKPEQAIAGVLGISLVIVVLSSAIKKILESSKIGVGEKGTSLRQILAMLAMIAVIKSAIASVLTVGEMTWGDMLKGVLGVSAVMVAFGVAMGLIYEATKTGIGQKGTSMAQVLELVAMVFAVKTLTNAVVKIGELPIEKIILAGLVVGALVNMFSKDLVVLNMTNGEGHTGEILAMAAAVWVMGDAVKKIAQLDPAEAALATICIAALMGVFSFAVHAASQISKEATLAIVGIAVAAGALMFLMTVLSESMGNDQAKRFKAIADSLTNIMLSFSIALVACGIVGKICKGADVTSGLLSMVKVILIIVAVLTAVGAIFNVMDSLFNGAASAALDKVIDVFEKLGQLIGKFVGGIVGGFQEAKAKSLEKVGSSLSTFATNAKTFLDLVGDTKKLKDITSGVSSLATAILKITAGDIIRRLNSLTGGGSDPFDKFSGMLEKLGPALKKFSKKIDAIKTNKVKNAIESFSEIVEAARKIPNQGGKIAEIFGDNTLGEFAKGLADFTPEFGGFLKAMKEQELFGDNRKNVKRAIDFANDVAEFAKNIPNEGGIIANIFGDNSLTSFATGITQFTPAFGGFLTAMKEQNLLEGDNAANVKKAIDFANDVCTFVNNLPDSVKQTAPDGTVFTDDKLSIFADGLTKFTPSFAGFLAGMALTMGLIHAVGGEKNVEEAIGYAQAMVGFVNALPPMKTVTIGDGIIATYTDNKLSQFADGLTAFTPAFSGFLEEMTITVYNPKAVDKAIQFADDVVAFVNGLPPEGFSVRIGDSFVFSTGPLVTLAAGLTAFAPSFSTFLSTMSETKFDSTKVGDAIGYAKAAAKMAAIAPRFHALKDIIWGEIDLDAFGDQLAKFAPNFKTYLETVGNASYDSSVVEKSNTLMESLAGIAGTLEGKAGILEKFFVGDDSLAGIGEGLGMFAGAMSDYSTALDSVNWDNAYKANEYITSLADLADKAISVNSLTNIPLEPIVQKIDEQMKALGPELTSAVYDMTNDEQTETETSAASEHIGELISQGIQNGFDNTIGTTKSTVDTTITDWLNELKGTVDGQLDTNSENTANTLIGVLEEDIHRVRDDLEPKVYADFTILMGRGVLAVEDKYNDFYNAGVYAMDGLINGIASREQEVYTRLDNLAIAMANTMQAGLDEHSPSKIFDKIGQFVPMGLSNGIDKAAPDALNTLRDSLIRPINAMTGMLNGDIEYSPKITPIVDLTGARASVGTLNGMFGSRSIDIASSTMRLSSANAKARRAATAKVYNDKNVVNAIDGLKGDIAALGGSIKNMGLYMDGDTLVGTIVDKVDKKLGTNQIRRKRYA